MRFIELAHTGWDQHSNLQASCTAQLHARSTSRSPRCSPTSKQRGLLEDTLVVWGGEFGRTPARRRAGDGRDHNATGFTMWLAGGGVKGGMRYGATDEYGVHAVENKMHIHDLHATILHLLGLDHEKLTYRYAGRDFRLTDVHGRVRERDHDVNDADDDAGRLSRGARSVVALLVAASCRVRPTTNRSSSRALPTACRRRRGTAGHVHPAVCVAHDGTVVVAHYAEAAKQIYHLAFDRRRSVVQRCGRGARHRPRPSVSRRADDAGRRPDRAHVEHLGRLARHRPRPPAGLRRQQRRRPHLVGARRTADRAPSRHLDSAPTAWNVRRASGFFRWATASSPTTRSTRKVTTPFPSLDAFYGPLVRTEGGHAAARQRTTARPTTDAPGRRSPAFPPVSRLPHRLAGARRRSAGRGRRQGQQDDLAERLVRRRRNRGSCRASG